MDQAVSTDDLSPTSTQVGAIGEALVTAGIILGSRGRLSPFRPFADDDGLDLLLFDKDSMVATPLQIKCRTKFDNPAAQTVQFDVRLKTLAQEGRGYILCALLDRLSVKTMWLFRAQEFREIAHPYPKKLTIVPSAKEASRDKFQRFRMNSFALVANRITTSHTA